MHRVVDAMNVIGSRPDGWWRDRGGAIESLAGKLERWAQETGERVTLVLERPPSPPPAVSAIALEWAPRPAPNSADAEIVRRLPGWLGEGEDVVLVTSDRELADRAAALGAAIEGSSGFRRRLEERLSSL
ncbi:MAG TPA: RNA-binding protein [Solirubrobacterales bacterium]|nr:RNA-binding protein [Solirubrobacterales bacterium]